ncbi:MAG: cyclase family protein [Halanaerobiales bacterium]
MSKKVDKKLMHKYAKELCNWGKWGDNDELGTLNYITQKTVLEATKSVKKGKVFSLAINFDEKGPQTGYLGRVNPLRYMVKDGTDFLVQENIGEEDMIAFADDVVMLPTHGVTHWDALSHVFYIDEDENGVKKPVMWNNYSIENVDSSGAKKCGIENTRDKLVSRGVLLDIPRYKGVKYLENGQGITIDDLEGCAEKFNIKIKQGDIILVRTGQLGRVLENGEWGDYAGGDAPGLEFETLKWIYEKKIATIASDTWGVEVRPNRSDVYYQPWHQIIIPIIGMIHGELFYLEELAKDCAQDNKYEFLLVSGTMPLTNGVGSPINPQAIK